MAAMPGGELPGLCIQIELVEMGNILVAHAIGDGAIGASPKPTPAVIRVRIFRVDDEVDPGWLSHERARDVKNKFTVFPACCESFGLFSLAPAPALPLAEEPGHPICSYFD